MTIYIVAAGAVGSIVFSVLFLLMLIKGNSLKIPFIGMAAFVILMAAGVVLTMLGDKEDGPDTADKVSQAVESQGVEETKGAENTQKPEQDEPAESGGTVESGPYTLPCGAEVQLFSSVRNDVTGNWRRSTTTGSLVPADYALEYYNALFSSMDSPKATGR